MPLRIVATLVLAGAVLCGTTTRSHAFILGDGKGSVESDCLIQLDLGDVEPPVPFGPKARPSVQCTDCDPTCDSDGVDAANGSCAFGVRACVNIPGPFVACTGGNLTKARAVAKRKGAAPIDFSPVAGAGQACGPDATVPVDVKSRKAGDRPGTAQVLLLATAAGLPRDRDKLLLVCNPRPAGQACPPATTTTTTTTLPPVLGTPFGLRTTASFQGAPRFVLRWNFDEGTLPVDTFLVHESATSFSDVNDATLIAALPASARAADVELRTGTGLRHFRVSAVSFDGLTNTVSPELVIDTTPRVVFIADKTNDDEFELFSVVPGSGLEPTPLSGSLAPGADVGRLFLSPDGRRVAFSADLNTDGVLELFIAPLDGSSAPQRVSGTFVTGGTFNPFLVAFSPDGSRVAFTGDKLVDERTELFVAPVDGSAEPVAVSGALVDGGDVDADGFAWSPDGRRLAFLADKRVNDTNELFVGDAAGGVEPTAVSGTLPEGGQVNGFAWAPDATRLAFRVGFDEVRVAGLDGTSEPILVSGVLEDFSTFNSNPVWSPDSTRIAMSGDLLTNAIFEVFVMSADGLSGPIRVSGTSQVFTDIVAFRWSPDGTRLVLSIDKNVDNADEVFVANAAGGAEPIRVSGAFAADEEAFNPQWSPRGDRVAYFADPNVAGRFELFIAEADVVDGALPASGPLGATNEVFQFAWAPDGASLVIVGSLETVGLSEVFVTPASGGGLPTKVSGAMQPNGGASSFTFGFAPLCN
jgi:Tol biopolymer transport system component